MAQRSGWEVGAFEHPLTPTVGKLLQLEETGRQLELARNRPCPDRCHQAAAALAAQLGSLSPRRLGDSLGVEIGHWNRHLEGLSRHQWVDTDKVSRLGALLEQLSRRLLTDWPDYFERLSHDPWLGAYRRRSEQPGDGFRPGPQAWAIIGAEAAGRRLERWRHELDPMLTTSGAGLRLMRDSVQTRGIHCPPEGYDLPLPAEVGSGLVRIDAPAGAIPEFLPRGTDLRLRFLAPDELTPATETVQATLGWFTL